MRILNLLCVVAAMTMMIVCADASDRRGKKSDCGGNCSTASCSNANACTAPTPTQAPAPTSTAKADCTCDKCCKVDKNGVANVDHLKVQYLQIGDGISISPQGVWITSPKTKGMVAMYLVEGQGPVVGIHRNKELTGPKGTGYDGFDLALALNNGEPSIQFRKHDGTLGWITTKELEAAIKK